MIIPFPPKFIMQACKNDPSLLNNDKVKIKLGELNADDAQVEMYESNGSIVFRALNDSVDTEIVRQIPQTILYIWLEKLGASIPPQGENTVERHKFSFQINKANNLFEMVLDNEHSFELEDFIFNALLNNSSRIKTKDDNYLFLIVPFLLDPQALSSFTYYIVEQDDETIKKALRMIQNCYAGDQWKNDREQILNTMAISHKNKGYPMGKTGIMVRTALLIASGLLVFTAFVVTAVLTFGTFIPFIALAILPIALLGCGLFAVLIDNYFQKRNNVKSFKELLNEVNNPAETASQHSTKNMQKMLDPNPQIETPAVLPTLEKSVAQHVKEIFDIRNALFIRAGGNPNADIKEQLGNSQLADKFARLVHKEINDRGLKTADVANFPEFKSGKLAIAMQLIMMKKLAAVSEEIFKNRDILWNKALELAGNDNSKQLLIFTLLLRQLFKSAGLNMADAKDLPVFGSGRLAQAMRVYITMKSANVAAPEDEEKRNAILLARKHAEEGEGLLTKANVKGAANINAAAKRAIFANHPDRVGDAGDQEVLFAGNEIINLQKNQLLDVYLAELERARNNPSPRK